MSLSKEAIDALAELEHTNGRLAPEPVVEAAKPKRSPLHPYFEWDNNKAGHKYRLDQARTIIRSVTMQVTVHRQEFTVPKYIRDPDLDESVAGYRRTSEVREEPDAAWKAVVAELARANAYICRARDLAIVLGHEAEIVEISEKIQRLQTKFSEVKKAA